MEELRMKRFVVLAMICMLGLALSGCEQDSGSLSGPADSMMNAAGDPSYVVNLLAGPSWIKSVYVIIEGVGGRYFYCADETCAEGNGGATEGPGMSVSRTSISGNGLTAPAGHQYIAFGLFYTDPAEVSPGDVQVGVTLGAVTYVCTNVWDYVNDPNTAYSFVIGWRAHWWRGTTDYGTIGQGGWYSNMLWSCALQ